MRRSAHLAGSLWRRLDSGVSLLEMLPEVEPPEALVTKIAYQAPLGRVRDPFDEQTAWSRFVQKYLQPVLQPRLVMGAAMAVLSFTMLERCTGTRVERVQAADLNPVTRVGRDGNEGGSVERPDAQLLRKSARRL